jgi:hypothetical protein
MDTDRTIAYIEECQMTVTVGPVVTLEAKPGLGDRLAEFLKAGREIALAEAGTVIWYHSGCPIPSTRCSTVLPATRTVAQP